MSRRTHLIVSFCELQIAGHRNFFENALRSTEPIKLGSTAPDEKLADG